jgi:2-hydroxychromene-2-carboxylate isomerase
MQREISYFFSIVSPWAYIGQALFSDLVRRHGVSVDYRPVALVGLFDETGGLPLAKRHPVRQRYRMLELQRWRAKRGLSFTLHPRHWPFDGKLADGLVIAIAEAGHDPAAFLRRAFPGIWERELDLADEAVLASLLDEAGLDPAPLLAAAKTEAVEARYAQNFQHALGSGVFGSPAYVLDGEVFWGQDRLELLDDALASGRAPYQPDA